jgi:hypothetical protein
LDTSGSIYLDVYLKPGEWISPTTLIKQISKTGFFPRSADVKISVTGRLKYVDGKLLLCGDNVETAVPRIVLRAAPNRNPTISRTIEERLKSLTIVSSQRVAVEGRWMQGDPAELGGLAAVVLVTQVKSAKAGENAKANEKQIPRKVGSE